MYHTPGKVIYTQGLVHNRFCKQIYRKSRSL